MRLIGLPLGLVLGLVACAGPADEAVGEVSDGLAHEQMADEALIVETALLDDSAEEAAMTADGGGRLPRPVIKLLDRWGAPFAPDCVKTTRWLDRDGDGLPSDATSTLACAADVDGTLVEVVGKVRVVDRDDASGYAGYYVEFDRLKVSETIAGADLARWAMLDGRATVGLGGSELSRSANRDLELTMVRVARGNELKRVLTMFADVRYTPGAGSGRDPFARGAVRMLGRWTLDADGRVSHMLVSTEPVLYYSRECATAAPQAPGFVRGALRTTDNWGVTLRTTFKACAEWDYAVFNEPR